VEWILLALGMIAWGWYSGTVAKEAAVRAARRLCERNGQQLLDETVAMQGMKPQRGANGRVGMLRRYSFEFSGDGAQRRFGQIALLGQWVVASQLDMGEYTLHEQEADDPPSNLH
jgi:hypothetical protein